MEIGVRVVRHVGVEIRNVPEPVPIPLRLMEELNAQGPTKKRGSVTKVLAQVGIKKKKPIPTVLKHPILARHDPCTCTPLPPFEIPFSFHPTFSFWQSVANNILNSFGAN